MKRKAGLVALCSALMGLASCGGGIQSPDFSPVLNGVVIEETSPLTVDVGKTLQLKAIGLYTLPPGTSLTAGEPCGKNSKIRCTRGDIKGTVVWTLPVADSFYATVDAAGLVKGVRRTFDPARNQPVTVTATLDGFTDMAPVIVDGEILSRLEFTPSSLKDSKLVPVPVGLRQPVAVQGYYTVRGSTAVSTTPRNVVETVNWAINDKTFADVESPTGGSNRLIGIKETGTPKPTLSVNAVNAEGMTITTNPVLNDVTVVAAVLTGLSSVRSDKDSIEIGEKLPLIAVGRFSDGMNRDLTRVVTGMTVSDDRLVTFAAAGTADSGGPVLSIDANSGIATGVAVGSSTVTATLKPNVVQDGLAFSRDPATASKVVMVKDRVCLVPFTNTTDAMTTPPSTTGTSTATASAPAASCAVANSCRVDSPESAITPVSVSATDAAVFKYGDTTTGYSLDLTASSTVTTVATATAPKRVGIIMGISDNSTDNAAGNNFQLRLVSPTGTVSANLAGKSVVDLGTSVGGKRLKLITANATSDFTGLRVFVQVQGNPFAALPPLPVPINGLPPLAALEFPVFQMCSVAQIPTTP